MLSLFLTFAKIGLFTFGGGYAMLPLFERVCVQEKQWITQEELVRMTVLAESTPGPIAINCATFIGYRQKGLRGAIAATLGVVLPSFVILLLIARFLDSYAEIPWIANAFKGVRDAVGILIVDAAIKMMRDTVKKPFSRAILLCAFVAMLLIDLFSLRFSSIGLMLIAAVVGLILFRIREAASQKGGDRK